MTDEVTYDGDVDALREATGGRVTEGPRGTVDVFDDRFGIFRRLDEGDKVVKFGKSGWTVEKEVYALGTDKNVSTRGAQGDEDTSVAGGFLTAQNPNVQQEVKDGGPTHADKGSGDHVEGADADASEDELQNGQDGEKTASANSSEVSEEEKVQNEEDEASQAQAAK